jgi:hypothetical protein
MVQWVPRMGQPTTRTEATAVRKPADNAFCVSSFHEVTS